MPISTSTARATKMNLAICLIRPSMGALVNQPVEEEKDDSHDDQLDDDLDGTRKADHRFSPNNAVQPCIPQPLWTQAPS